MEFVGIDLFCLFISGSQSDVEIIFIGNEALIDEFVQEVIMVLVHLIEAHSIESVDEIGIGLAIDLGERDSLEIQVLHGVGIKEELAAVVGGKEFTFFLLGNNRCNLREVADENDLDSPKRLVFVGAKAA